MGLFILKKTRVSQPVSEVGIDLENPLTRGLIRLYDFNNGGRDAVKNSKILRWTLGARGKRVDGRNYGQLVNQTGTVTSGESVSDLISSGITVMFFASKVGNISGASDFIFGAHAGLAGAYNWGFYEPFSSPTNLQFYIHNGTSGAAAGATGQWAVGNGPQVWVATYGNGDSNIRLYQDGLQRGSAAQTGNVRATALDVRSCFWNSGTPNFNFILGGIWNRRLSPEEVKQLSANPWQLFEKESVFIGSVSGGGNAYDETFSETINITASSLQFTIRTISDTLVVVASSIATAIRTVSDTFSIVSSNVNTAIRTINDTLSITDTLEKTPGKIISETLSIADTIVRVIIHVVSDTITVFDTKLATMIRSLTDDIFGTDTTTKTMARTASDTFTISETMTAALIFSRTLTETILVTDIRISTIIRNISETISGTDTISRTTARTANDSLNMADTITVSLILSRTLSETIVLTDAIIKVIGRTLTETISIVESFLNSATQIYKKLRGSLRNIVIRGGVKRTNIR